ncbi:MAG: HAD-IA family hydrolase [Bacillota bacterium]
MNKYILFDLDGTLIDSLPIIRQTFEHVFREMNLPWEEEQIMETVGLPLIEVCRRFGGERQQEMFDRYLRQQETLHDHLIRGFPGAVECLTELRRKGLSLGVVTAKRRRLALQGLRLTAMAGFFSIVVAMEDTAKHKPDPEPVLKAMEGLKADPALTVFIGDSPFDIAAGKNAGIKTIGVTWGMASAERLRAQKPDFLADNWEQLLQHLITN